MKKKTRKLHAIWCVYVKACNDTAKGLAFWHDCRRWCLLRSQRSYIYPNEDVSSCMSARNVSCIYIHVYTCLSGANVRHCIQKRYLKKTTHKVFRYMFLLFLLLYCGTLVSSYDEEKYTHQEIRCIHLWTSIYMFVGFCEGARNLEALFNIYRYIPQANKTPDPMCLYRCWLKRWLGKMHTCDAYIKPTHVCRWCHEYDHNNKQSKRRPTSNTPSNGPEAPFERGYGVCAPNNYWTDFFLFFLNTIYGIKWRLFDRLDKTFWISTLNMVMMPDNQYIIILNLCTNVC